MNNEPVQECSRDNRFELVKPNYKKENVELSLMENRQLDEDLKYLIDALRDHVALGRSIDDAVRNLKRRFGDEEISAAVSAFKSQYKEMIENEGASTLTENRKFEGWYERPETDSKAHWPLLKAVLRNKSRAWTEEMINSLDLSSTTVLSHLAPPKSETSVKVKGLVLGYVQSGKTANFSAVIAKGVDAGYRLVVVLSGMHNNLRLQTQARLHEELVKPKEGAALTLTRVDENGDFQKRQSVTANHALSKKDGFTLVVLKKNTHVLRSFNSWLSGSSEEVVNSCPALIIDDESDQASINTNVDGNYSPPK